MVQMGRVSTASQREIQPSALMASMQFGRSIAHRLAELETLLPTCLLLLALLVFWGVIHVPVFVDEADNVMGACLIGRGAHAYQDFFSHHFPMPYYVLAAFGEPMSCSVLAGRLVGIVSLALAGAAFARITHNPASAFALLLLALVAPLYYLQLFVAEVLVSVGLIVGLALLTDQGRRMRDPLSYGLRFIALTILAWSSPIGLMMAAIVMALMVAGADRRFLAVGAACLASILVWPVALLLHGSLRAFTEQAVLFNVQVYSRFLDVGLTNPLDLLWQTLTFVRHRFSFVVDWMIGQKTDATPATFAVGLELLLVVLLGLLLVRSRKERLFRIGVCLLLPLSVARDGFHLAPFVVLASFACAHLLSAVSGRSRLMRAMVLAIAVIAVRIYFFYLPVERNAPDELAQSLQPEGRVAQMLAPDDTVLYLPIAPQGYLALDRQPGSFYTFFLPWQAAVPGAEDRIIADIEQNRVAVIVVDQDAQVWEKYRLSDYAPHLVAHIMANYHPLDGNDRRKARIFARNGS
jgi:hypothetical protein